MAFRIPILDKGCYCLSLRTAIKIIGFLSLVDSLSVFLATAFALKYAVKDCSAERLACSVILGDVLLRTIHAGFAVALLLSVYKATHPRFILWWVYATLFVSVLTTFILVPAVNKVTRNTQWIYYAFSLWDLYSCLIGYSYYMNLTEGQLSSGNEDA